jgi:hypothetical protein
MKKHFKYFLVLLVLLQTLGLFAQEEESLLDLLGPEEPLTTYATASFKTNRIINSHSLENTAKGVMDVKISHRFGFLNTGYYEIFGLDQATIRLGIDYGLLDWLTIGAGRSSYEKTYDGYVKARILRQSKGAKNMPLTLSVLSTMSINTLKFEDPERLNYSTNRYCYAFQLIMGRKFSEGFTLQLMPSMVHRNLVQTVAEAHDVFALGAGARQKLGKRLSVNVEYYYVLPNQILPEYTNSLSVGFDIETGGHVFQLHFTNSTGMIEKAFITENTGSWLDGGVHFGFNVSRVFTLNRGKKEPKEL